MQSLGDNERKEILGEILADELKIIKEYVKDIPTLKLDVSEIKTDVSELNSDMKIVKAAITDISKQANDNERRIARLEAA